MKILVTGVAGFIGFHLVNSLVKDGYEVIGLDSINDYYDTNIKYDRLKELGINDPVLNIAKSLEDEALNDSYFVDRKLYPNVDFYSGIIYRALGIPTDMFTVMFALGRIPGWIAQWIEMRKNMEPIGRPRQIYTGHTKRSIS